MGHYQQQLAEIRRKIGPRNLIIGGDSNAKSTWWGSEREDARGGQMCGALHEMNLNILNAGDVPTFDTVRGGQRIYSHIDLTACSPDLLPRTSGWRVLEGLTSSDHNGMEYIIHLKKAQGVSVQRTTRIYNTKKANWRQFREKLAQYMQRDRLTEEDLLYADDQAGIEELTEKYTKAIMETCKDTIPRKKKGEVLTMPWWNVELANMKRQVATSRRRIRNAAPTRRPYVVGEYLKQKEKYITAVKEAQTSSWKEFCGKQDREGLWEGIYRVLRRTETRTEDQLMVVGHKTLSAEESAKLLAQTFYPEDAAADDNDDHKHTREMAETVNDGGHDDHDDPPFTSGELARVLKSFNPRKAPGSDGLELAICQNAIEVNENFFLGLINKCLETEYFPKLWKSATVIVLKKPGKTTYDTPKAYRPIGLLPLMGKIYEKLLVTRLRYHLTPRISPRQYGFMPQKSTEDSLYTLITKIRTTLDEKKSALLISLDIEGAFDNAWWPAIRTRLAEEECPRNLRRVIDSYLRDRNISLRYAGSEVSRGTTKGCVQGSIGGPLLWNVLLDPLLRQLEEGGVCAQAFADDVVLLFDGATALDMEGRANAALALVAAWGVRNKLRFAAHKTSAMFITRKLKYDTPRLSMGGVGIGLSPEIKILGLTVDAKLTFNAHVKTVCQKGINIYKQLARAAKVSWGLSPEVTRTIYTAVVEPVILYAASAWAPAVNKLGVRKQLSVLQRGFAQKICRAYRTVSLNSALILSGILPLDLRVREAATLYMAKRGLEGASMAEVGDREVERMAPVTDFPHPAEQISLGFQNLVDEEQLANCGNYQLKIFTDGSKIEGRVGAALSLWDSDGEVKALKLTLSSHCTVYQAELLALCKALEIVSKRRETPIAIFSDSRAALQTVTNVNATHPLAVRAREEVGTTQGQGRIIDLYWVKAHVGIAGNERADSLAKEAAARSKRRPNYDACPVSFVKRQIRMGSLDEWNRRYKGEPTASTTKIFLPDAIQANKILRQMTLDHTLVQVLTGHGGFSEYLHRFKCKENPSCACEPGVPESVTHIITQCPIHSSQRHNTEQKLGEKISAENLSKLMLNKKSREIVIPYLKEVCVKVNSRNKTQ